jgi:hypothetical protein
VAASATRGALPGSHCKQAVAFVAAAEGLKVLKGHAVVKEGNEACESRKCRGSF